MNIDQTPKPDQGLIERVMRTALGDEAYEKSKTMTTEEIIESAYQTAMNANNNIPLLPNIEQKPLETQTPRPKLKLGPIPFQYIATAVAFLKGTEGEGNSELANAIAEAYWYNKITNDELEKSTLEDIMPKVLRHQFSLSEL